jgi:hypothetical protein
MNLASDQLCVIAVMMVSYSYILAICQQHLQLESLEFLAPLQLLPRQAVRSVRPLVTHSDVDPDPIGSGTFCPGWL